jgi:nitrite reductase/ring-hydroxylating ferredoxin subunit
MNEDTSQQCYSVCSVGQLKHAESLEFSLPLGQQACFLINWEGHYYAYLNTCPHTQVSLNWTPNQFFDVESKFIQCSLHGALFEPDTGFCLYGPCQGKSLTGLPVLIQNERVCIDLNNGAIPLKSP